ncbi:hypothetical protein D3C81_1594840 [compost metagenome]
MGQRDIGPVIGRRRRRIGRCQTVQRGVPHQHRHDPRHHRPPESRQRSGDADQPVPDEARRPAPLQHHVAEQARDQEEARHAEQVNDEEQAAGPDRGLVIAHDPDLARKEGQGRVQHHPQQQGRAPQPIQSVKPLALVECGCRHVALLFRITPYLTD